MHIAFVSREYPSNSRCGGIGYYIRDIGRALAALGHRVSVITSCDRSIGVSDVVSDDGIALHRLRKPDYLTHSPASLRDRVQDAAIRMSQYSIYRKAIANYLESIQEEIDLVEFADYGAEAAVWLSRKRPIPTIIRLHGPTLLNRETGTLSRFRSLDPRARGSRDELKLLSASSGVTAPSHAMVDWIRKYGPHGLRNVSVISNAIDYDYWSQLQAIDRHKAILVVYAGTVSLGKGCLDLITACSSLRKKGLNIELVIAGRGGQLLDKLRKQALYCEEYIGWIRLTGPISRSELRILFQAAAVCAFPSWWEPFGLVCGEAMASGSIVVGSAAGGMSDMIESGRSGYLVNPRDPVALEAAIRHALDLCSEDRRRMASAAQDTIRERFSSKRIAPKMIEYYGQFSA